MDGRPGLRRAHRGIIQPRLDGSGRSQQHAGEGRLRAQLCDLCRCRRSLASFLPGDEPFDEGGGAPDIHGPAASRCRRRRTGCRLARKERQGIGRGGTDGDQGERGGGNACVARYRRDRRAPLGLFDRLLCDVARLRRHTAGWRSKPSLGIIDTQSVKCIPVRGPRGYDAANKVLGRKRVALVDAAGTWLAIAVVPASTQEADTLPALDRGEAGWPSLPLQLQSL